MTIEIPGNFTETVLFEEDNGYMIAHGWTSSTGQTGGWKYTPPSGWEFDSRYSDIPGEHGTHGGCRTCLMTLVHLISIEPVGDVSGDVNGEIDLCKDMICVDGCYGYDLYTLKCVDGICVKDSLIEANSPTCGYVDIGNGNGNGNGDVEEEDLYNMLEENAGYILLAVAAGFAVTKLIKR